MDDFPLTPNESLVREKIKMVLKEIKNLNSKINDPAGVLKDLKVYKTQLRIMEASWIVLNAAHIVKFGYQFPVNLELNG